VVVHALAFRGEELLLLRRAGTGFMDGYYCLPGGHQHLGESVDAALRREFHEETGAIAGEVQAVCVMPYRYGAHQGMNLIFEVHSWRGEPHLAEPELFSEILWSESASLPELATPWIADVLAARREGRWFQELYGP
jgi:8-oxo-dGTP pyrophosphatase MutT (NUDIX family)